MVVKRKDGKYTQQALWYKVLNPTYTQKSGRQDFSKDSKENAGGERLSALGALVLPANGAYQSIHRAEKPGRFVTALFSYTLTLSVSCSVTKFASMPQRKDGMNRAMGFWI